MSGARMGLRYPRWKNCIIVVAVPAALAVSGCAPRADSSAPRNGSQGPVAVDIARARPGSLRPRPEFTGTTRPTREVVLRTRTEGRLLSLSVDVGDAVRRGQSIGRLDDELPRQALRQAESELASLESQAAAARTRVGDAQAQVRQAEADLAQKRADFRRSILLYGEGFVPRRDAELARTAERVAVQTLNSERQQVKNAQADVRAAEARVRAQRSVVAQERERLSFVNLVAPLSGFITARATEAGTLLAPGAEVVRIGDFRWVQVDVQVSELEMRDVRIGQTVRVALDALPGQEFTGRVDRISPQADPISRLVPLTITIGNPDLKIGAGLLARVRFGSAREEGVVIPEAALQRSRGRQGQAPAPPAAPRAAREEAEVTTETVFVLEPSPAPPPEGQQPEATVRAREVRVGERAEGLVQVVEGLEPGEPVVSRSARPLRDGDKVVLSLLAQEALREPAPQGRRGGSAPGPAPRFPRGSGPVSPGAGGGGGFGAGSRSSGGISGGGSFGGTGAGGSAGGGPPVVIPSPGPAGAGGRRTGEITAGPGGTRSGGRPGGGFGSGGGSGFGGFGGRGTGRTPGAGFGGAGGGRSGTGVGGGF